MNIVIYGFGSVGAVLANLIKLGDIKNEKSIHLVGRKPIIDEIKENGLKYRHHDENSEIETKGYIVHTNINEIPKADVIFLTMKACDLKISLEHAREFIKHENPVVILAMNGLGLREIVRKYIDDSRIIELSVNYPSRLEGNIVYNSGGNAFFVAENSLKNKEVFFSKIFDENSDIPVSKEKRASISEFFRFETNFTAMQWKKAIANIGMNAISAITMLKVGEVLERYTLVLIIRNIVNEAVEVANKLGIHFNMDLFNWFIDFASKDPNHKTSTYQDIFKHKKTEIDFMNGYIVTKGKELGIATPANEAITSLMHLIEKDLE